MDSVSLCNMHACGHIHRRIASVTSSSEGQLISQVCHPGGCTDVYIRPQGTMPSRCVWLYTCACQIQNPDDSVRHSDVDIDDMPDTEHLCVRVCECARACVCVCVRARMCACMHVCMKMQVRAMAEVSAHIVCLCLHRDESLYRGMSLHLSVRQPAGKTGP